MFDQLWWASASDLIACTEEHPDDVGTVRSKCVEFSQTKRYASEQTGSAILKLKRVTFFRGRTIYPKKSGAVACRELPGIELQLIIRQSRDVFVRVAALIKRVCSVKGCF